MVKLCAQLVASVGAGDVAHGDFDAANNGPEIDGRRGKAELWQPLFSVCTVAAPHRVIELQGIANSIAGAKSENEGGDYSIQLLNDVRAAFAQSNGDSLPTSVLLQTLNRFDESPWAGWSDGKGLDSHALARLLRPFHVRSRSLRCGEHVVKGYLRQSFEDAWERYL